VPYRKGLNFTLEGLRSATTAIERLRNFKLRLESAKLEDGVNTKLVKDGVDAVNAFRAALDDDLNTAEALAAIFEYVREANTALDQGQLLALNRGGALAVLQEFDSFFDVLTPSARSKEAEGLTDAEIEKLIAERTAAKKARDFAQADRIRAQLLEQGIILEDTKDGIRWKRK
jgi:cysteinyl-tRNA synthetase